MGNYYSVPTGFTAFDRRIKGLRPGDLVCIGSRPGMGKTALGLNIAANLALAKDPWPVLYFSLGMSRHTVLQRLFEIRGAVDLHHVGERLYRPKNWPSLPKAAASISRAPLYICDSTESLSLEDIRFLSRYLDGKLRENRQVVRIIIIDSLQLIEARPSDNRRQEVSKIVRELKIIARSLMAPVVLLSLVKRRCPQGSHHDLRPRLTDLEESPAIAREADVVAFLYREGYYNQADPRLEGKAELILAKNKRGNEGTIPLKFARSLGQFSDAKN